METPRLSGTVSLGIARPRVGRDYPPLAGARQAVLLSRMPGAQRGDFLNEMAGTQAHNLGSASSGLRLAGRQAWPVECRTRCGEMSEWLKEHDWKSCRR